MATRPYDPQWDTECVTESRPGKPGVASEAPIPERDAWLLSPHFVFPRPPKLPVFDGPSSRFAAAAALPADAFGERDPFPAIR